MGELEERESCGFGMYHRVPTVLVSSLHALVNFGGAFLRLLNSPKGSLLCRGCALSQVVHDWCLQLGRELSSSTTMLYISLAYVLR